MINDKREKVVGFFMEVDDIRTKITVGKDSHRRIDRQIDRQTDRQTDS